MTVDHHPFLSYQSKICNVEVLCDKVSSEFLDAFSHLYERVCPFVSPSIRQSVTHDLKSSKIAILTKIERDKGLDQECRTI